MKLPRLNIFFSWQIWGFLSLLVVIWALSKWQLNPILDSQTFPFFIRWHFSALITWTILFFSQVYLYQKKGIDNIIAFTLSYYGVFLASALYELPHFPSYLPYRLLTVICFVAILIFCKWKPIHLTKIIVAIICGWKSTNN